MKILITGKDGQVGWELCRSLSALGEIEALGRSELDLSNANAIRHAIRSLKPDLIVNAAAYTAVDKAEEDRDRAFKINAVAPQVMAEEAAKSGAAMVHYSTDYVFSGEKRAPYTEDDITGPINVYGASKLAGEQGIDGSGAAYLILRTSWVYAARGKNFFLTMLRLGATQKELKIVHDQIGAPTWARSIAEATTAALKDCFHDRHFTKQKGIARIHEQRGIYNLSSQGSTSWFGFARAILGQLMPDVSVKPISSGEYKTAARRPSYSVLDGMKLKRTFGVNLPHWEEALRTMIAEGGFSLPAAYPARSSAH
jgi:dTDP-4-dehydrorhamnose reductase